MVDNVTAPTRRPDESMIGLVKLGELGELYVDGTRSLADANRNNTLTAAKTLGLLEQIDRELQERLASITPRGCDVSWSMIDQTSWFPPITKSSVVLGKCRLL